MRKRNTVSNVGDSFETIPIPVTHSNTSPSYEQNFSPSPQSSQRKLKKPSQERQNQGQSQTTFFDGSYFSPTGNENDRTSYFKRRHRLFDYQVPRWSYIYNTTLVVLDMLMALLSTTLVFFASPQSYLYLQQIYLVGNGVVEFTVLACVTWIVSLASCHIYSRHTMGEGYRLYGDILEAAFIQFIVLCTASYLLKLDFPRSLTIFVPVLSALFTVVERWLMRRALHRNRRKGEFNYPTIVVGSPEGIHDILRQLRANAGIGYKPIAICPVTTVSDNQTPNTSQLLVSVPFTPVDDFESQLRVLPMNSHLPQTAKYLKAQTVLVSDVMMTYSETMKTLCLAVESIGIELAVTSTVADLNGAKLHLRNDPTMPILTARLPQYSSLTRAIKRVMDIILSSIALLISAPIMLACGILIKHEDGGPVFYSQQRIGIYGEPFTMYKLRSMRVDADEIKARLTQEQGLEDRFIFKMKDDPRITKIGQFIRKTSLDEFPQFLNVFKGDMSMVGPRPPLPEEVARYGTLYSTRLLAKPGITGPWQISGRSNLSQEQSEYADVSYVQNWSITSDIAILLKTVLAVVRGTGAY